MNDFEWKDDLNGICWFGSTSFYLSHNGKRFKSKSKLQSIKVPSEHFDQNFLL